MDHLTSRLMMLIRSYTAVPFQQHLSCVYPSHCLPKKFVALKGNLDHWEASLQAVRKSPGPKSYAVKLFCKDDQAYIFLWYLSNCIPMINFREDLMTSLVLQWGRDSDLVTLTSLLILGLLTAAGCYILEKTGPCFRRVLRSDSVLVSQFTLHRVI